MSAVAAVVDELPDQMKSGPLVVVATPETNEVRPGVLVALKPSGAVDVAASPRTVVVIVQLVAEEPGVIVPRTEKYIVESAGTCSGVD